MARKGKKTQQRPTGRDVTVNRQARFRYELLEKWEAGIELMGSEVKSLRDGKADLKDAYAAVRDGEVWLMNSHIAPYAAIREGEVWLMSSHIAPYGPASQANHEMERPRKLLLHRHEISRLIGKTKESGLTLVPTRIYFKGPHAKVEIALAKGKEQRDKRRTIKEREAKRDIERALKERGR